MAPGIVMHLLLIERDDAETQRIQKALQSADPESVTVTTVSTVHEAYQEIKQHLFSAILLSIYDVSGLDDVQCITAAAPDTPLIVLSETEDEQVAMNALHAGAQDCLFKPQSSPQLLARASRYAIERARTQEQLTYLAHYDSVTGLPNRELYRDRLAQSLIHAQRKGLRVAVMFLDLDHFKSVNDMLGHDAGDQLLRDVALRIKEQLRRGDTLARMGGDEFTIILDDVRETSSIAAVAQKICDSMSRAFVVGGEEIFITTSVGIAAYPSCGIEPMQLTKNADAALYHAKESGRGCYRFYDPEMNRLASDRIKTTTQLRHAIVRSEFSLHYQPQFDPISNAVLGFEALLRWQPPDRELVCPANFISLLEDTGLIVQVGEWALRSACMQQKLWSDAGYSDMRVAVNVSARQFRQKDFVSMVSKILRDTEVNPHCLQLEITESLLVENIAAAAATLRALHTIGVRFSIDDFGTGYSSLNYLKQFPLHSIKVDQSFIRNISRDKDDAAIVSAIITLGHSLGMKVVAEGVETEKQLEILVSKGCDAVQGYYYSVPLPALDVQGWLKDQSRRAVVAPINAMRH